METHKGKSKRSNSKVIPLLCRCCCVSPLKIFIPMAISRAINDVASFDTNCLRVSSTSKAYHFQSLIQLFARENVAEYPLAASGIFIPITITRNFCQLLPVFDEIPLFAEFIQYFCVSRRFRVSLAIIGLEDLSLRYLHRVRQTISNAWLDGKDQIWIFIRIFNERKSRSSRSYFLSSHGNRNRVTIKKLMSNQTLNLHWIIGRSSRKKF